jgi:hypothetical protein
MKRCLLTPLASFLLRGRVRVGGVGSSAPLQAVAFSNKVNYENVLRQYL